MPHQMYILYQLMACFGTLLIAFDIIFRPLTFPSRGCVGNKFSQLLCADRSLYFAFIILEGDTFIDVILITHYRHPSEILRVQFQTTAIKQILQ